MAQTRPSPTLSRGFTRLGRFLAPYAVREAIYIVQHDIRCVAFEMPEGLSPFGAGARRGASPRRLRVTRHRVRARYRRRIAATQQS